MRRQADVARDASAARVDEKLSAAGFRTRIWRGSKGIEGGAQQGRLPNEAVRIYVSEPRGSGRTFKGYKDHGYVSVHLDGSRHYDGVFSQKGTIRNLIEG